jgi:flagellar biosynthesis/type III secretory pathway protein FliH
MSARLFKGGTPAGLACAPFTIPPPPGTHIVAEEQSTAAPAVESEASLAADPEEQAQSRLEAAQREATRLLTEAQTQAAQIEQEAHEKGLAAARAQVDEEVQTASADLRGQFTRSLTELESLYTVITSRAERDLVKLALGIARKVVHREVTTDPDIVVTLARVALERLHPRAVATVLLHPDDFEYVNAQRQTLSSTGAVEIVADRAVGRGGCIVQSEHGDIDARIEQQFASLERGFFE